VNKTVTSRVLREVYAEREAQEKKWGQQNHEPAVYLSILVEEVGEVAQDVNDAMHPNDDGDDEAGCLAAAREELIQVAAVAVGMIEALDRRGQRTARHALHCGYASGFACGCGLDDPARR
jgi:NTP pyrophosphatase (non-canonical NTP hydrolase)